MKTNSATQLRRLGVVIILLLLQLFIRAHNITALDPYVDEGFHVKRAAIVWNFQQNPGQFSKGKVLLYFWLGLFQGDPLSSLYVSRAAIAMFSVITGATIYLLGRLLRDHKTGVIALGIYAILPLAFFFERLAFADPFAAAFAALVAWRSLVFARHPSKREGVVLGVLLAATTLAKLTMGLVPLLPVAAALIYYPWKRAAFIPQAIVWLRAYAPPLIIAAVVVALIWSPLAIPAYFARNGGQPFELVDEFNLRADTPDTRTPGEYFNSILPLVANYTGYGSLEYFLKQLQQVVNELRAGFNGVSLANADNSVEAPNSALDMVVSYGFLIVAGLTLVYLLAVGIRQPTQFRNALFIAIWVLTMTLLVILLASVPTSRYFMPIAMPIALALAYFATSLWHMHRVRLVLAGIFGVWAAVVALPFMAAAWNDPLNIPLKNTNWVEYTGGVLSSDDAVRAAAGIVNMLWNSGKPIYATWAICHEMYFYVRHEIPCVMGRNTPRADLSRQLYTVVPRGDYVFVVFVDYADSARAINGACWEKVAEFDKARVTRPITVWRVWLADSC